jgi:hypothetical protein
MWNIDEIEASAVELDFSSSGQGRKTATAIKAAGIQLFSAIELVDFDPIATQVYVCVHCGFPQCSPGGWVAFRRLGDSVVWLPAWDRMEQGDWELSEFSPPLFMKTRGAPVFSNQVWNRICNLDAGIPDAGTLPTISSRETARLCQLSAPGRVLGTFPAVPRTRRDLLVAVTEGDLAAEAECVDQCLREHFEENRALEPAPQRLPVAPIEFWLDLPGTPSWKSFAHLGNHTCCFLDGILPLVRTALLTNDTA